MGAFDPLWHDIDQTPPGKPYVVDSSGWGWCLLFVLASLPFLLLGALISSAATLFARYLWLILPVHLAFSALLGLWLYPRGSRRRALGVAASVVDLMPLPVALALYMVPFALLSPGFSSAFDFVLLLGLGLGGEFFLCKLAQVMRSAAVHLVLSLVLLALTGLLCWAGIGGESALTWDSIRALY